MQQRWLLVIFLAALVSGTPVKVSEEDDSSEEMNDEDFWPEQWQDYPDGFWFGTQDLSCVNEQSTKVLSSQFVSASSRRKRFAMPAMPDIFSKLWQHASQPRRFTLTSLHRLIYYKNQIYEWGMGRVGYHFGPLPTSKQCEITWEETPAGESDCDDDSLSEFTVEYEENYGGYHLITNNCHHYANRVAGLLASEECEALGKDFVDPDALARGSWVYVKKSIKKGLEDLIKLFDDDDEDEQHGPIIS